MRWRRYRYRGALALWTLLMLLSGLLRGGPAYATTPPLTQGNESAILLTVDESPDGDQEESATSSDDEGAAPGSDEMVSEAGLGDGEERATEPGSDDAGELEPAREPEGSEELMTIANSFVRLNLDRYQLPADATEPQILTLSGFPEAPTDLSVSVRGYFDFGSPSYLYLDASEPEQDTETEFWQVQVTVEPILRPGAYYLETEWEGGYFTARVWVGAPNVNIQTTSQWGLMMRPSVEVTAVGGLNDGQAEMHAADGNGLVKMWLPSGAYRLSAVATELGYLPLDLSFEVVAETDTLDLAFEIVAPTVTLTPETIVPGSTGPIVMEAAGFPEQPSPWVDLMLNDPAWGWTLVPLDDATVVFDAKTETWKLQFQFTPDFELILDETYHVLFVDGEVILGEATFGVQERSHQLTLTPTEVTYGQSGTIRFRVTGFDEEPTDPIVQILDPTDWPLCCAVSNIAVAFVDGDWELSFDVAVSDLDLGEHNVDLLWGDDAKTASVPFMVVGQPPPVRVWIRPEVEDYPYSEPLTFRAIFSAEMLDEPLDPRIEIYRNDTLVEEAVVQGSVKTYWRWTFLWEEDLWVEAWHVEFEVRTGLSAGEYTVMIDYAVGEEGAGRAEGSFQIYEDRWIQFQPNWVPVDYTGEEILEAHGFTRDPSQAEISFWALSPDEELAEIVTIVTSHYDTETGTGWLQFSLAPGLAPGTYALEFEVDEYSHFYNYFFVGQPNVTFQVTDGSGTPLSFSFVRVENANDEYQYLVTDAWGEAAAQLTPGATYRIDYVEHRGILHSVNQTFTVPQAGGEPLTIPIALTPPPVLVDINPSHYGSGYPEPVTLRAVFPGSADEPLDPTVRLYLNETGIADAVVQGSVATGQEDGFWYVEFEIRTGLGAGEYTVMIDYTVSGEGAGRAEGSFQIYEEHHIQFQPNWVPVDYTGEEILKAHGFTRDPSQAETYFWALSPDEELVEVVIVVASDYDTETGTGWLQFSLAPGLAPGKYLLEFEVDKYFYFYNYFFVGQPNVTFQVTDGSGTPLSGAHVRVENENEYQDLYTDAWGEAPAQLTPGATYRIEYFLHQGILHSVNQTFTVPQVGGEPLTIPIAPPPPVRVWIKPPLVDSRYSEPFTLRAIFSAEMLDEPLDPRIEIYRNDTLVEEAVVQGSVKTDWGWTFLWEEDLWVESWHVEFEVRTGLSAGEYTVMIDYVVGEQGARRAEGHFEIVQDYGGWIQFQPNWVPIDYTGEEILEAHGFTRDPSQAVVAFWALSSYEELAEIVTIVTSDYDTETGTGWLQFSLAPGLAPGTYALQFEVDRYFFFYNYFFVGKPNVIFTIEDADGAPVPLVRLIIEEVGGEQDPQEFVVGEYGQAEYRLTPGTTYRVIQADDDLTNTAWPLDIEFTVPAEGESPLVVQVALGAREVPNVVVWVEDEAGAPIANASLVIEAEDGSLIYTQTDYRGIVRLNLPPGQYFLTEISYTRNVTTRIPFVVAADTGFTGFLGLPDANVTITLLTGSGPLPGVWLEIRPVNDTSTAIWEPTDNDGKVHLQLEPETEYRLRLTLLNNAIPLDPQTFVVPAADEAPLALEVQLLVSVVEITLAEDDVALANYWVKIVPDDGTGNPSQNSALASTWSTGSHTLTAYLQDGRYHLVEVGLGSRVVKVAFPFQVNGPTLKTFNLSAANVVLHVVDGADEPVPHALLQIRPLATAPDGSYQSDWVTTNESGQIRLELYPEEYLIVGATLSDLTLPMYWVFVAPDWDEEALHMTVRLEPNATIQLLDEEEHPLIDTWVRIEVDGDGPAMNVQTDANGYLALSLMPATYRIVEISNATRYAKTELPFTVTDTFDGRLALPQPNVVIRLTGAGAANATLQIRPADAPPHAWDAIIWAEADGDGIARLSLPAGEAYVLVGGLSGDIFNLLQRPFTTPAAAEPPLELAIALDANLDAVLLNESGEPMQFTWATIRNDAMVSYSATTDAEGRMRLSLPPGSYTLIEVGSASRYELVAVPFVVDADEGYVGTLQLPATTLAIDVVDANGPVAFATVTVRGGALGQGARARTDSNGTARFSLQPGTYVVVGVDRSSGIVPTSQPFTIEVDKVTELTLSLVPNVRVTLWETDDTYLMGAWVVIKPDNGDGHPVSDLASAIHIQANASGRIVLNLAPGTYHIVEVVTHEWQVSTLLTFTVDADGFTGEFRLPAHNVEVQVRDENDNGIARAWIRVMPAAASLDASHLSIWVETDEEGRALITLPAGAPFRLVGVSTSDRWVRLNRSFTVPEDGEPIATIDVSLAPNVKATLQRNDGTAIANAWLLVRPDNGSGHPSPTDAVFAQTDANGLFQLMLADGTYHVVQVGTEQGLIATRGTFTVDAGAFIGAVKLPEPRVTVTLVHQDESPAAYAWVAVHPAAADPFDFSQVTWFQADQHGEVAITLEPGEYVIYHVDTLAGWYMMAPQPLTVGDDPVELPIRLWDEL